MDEGGRKGGWFMPSVTPLNGDDNQELVNIAQNRISVYVQIFKWLMEIATQVRIEKKEENLFN